MSPILDLILHCYTSLVKIFSLHANFTEFLAYISTFFFLRFENFHIIVCQLIIYHNKVELQAFIVKIIRSSLLTGIDELGKE